MSVQTDYAVLERRARLRRRAGRAAAYLLLTFWAVMVLFPFYWMILTSREELRRVQFRIRAEVLHAVADASELRRRVYGGAAGALSAQHADLHRADHGRHADRGHAGGVRLRAGCPSGGRIWRLRCFWR